MLPLHEIDVANFRSLQEVRVVLGPLNVLVGPNAAGKSNLLEALAFLGDLARTDVAPALEVTGACPPSCSAAATRRRPRSAGACAAG